jgi:hypothetical protein
MLIYLSSFGICEYKQIRERKLHNNPESHCRVRSDNEAVTISSNTLAVIVTTSNVQIAYKFLHIEVSSTTYE